MGTLTSDVIGEIVDLLSPFVQTTDQRRAFATEYLAGIPVPGLSFDSDVRTFIVNLVGGLDGYGNVADGTPALALPLIGIRKRVGHDKIPRIDALLSSITSKKAKDRANERPKDANDVGQDEAIKETGENQEVTATRRAMLVFDTDGLTLEEVDSLLDKLRDAVGRRLVRLRVEYGSTKVIVQGDTAALERLEERQKTGALPELGRATLEQVAIMGSASPPQVVLLVHGIRTSAAWASSVRAALSRAGRLDIAPIRYGFFDLIRFLAPPFLGFRKSAVDTVTTEIRAAQTRHPDWAVSVIAHSFGSYVIANALRRNRELRIHRLVLCGSVLPHNYAWGELSDQIAEPIINEVGTRDIWPVLAKVASWGYGDSGTFGFGSVLVKDRYHHMGHGGFLNAKFAVSFWLDWLRHGVLRTSAWDAERPKSSYLVSVLSVTPLKTIAALAFSVLLLVCCLRPPLPAAPTPTPYSHESIIGHPTLGWLDDELHSIAVKGRRVVIYTIPITESIEDAHYLLGSTSKVVLGCRAFLERPGAPPLQGGLEEHVVGRGVCIALSDLQPGDLVLVAIASTAEVELDIEWSYSWEDCR